MERSRRWTGMLLGLVVLSSTACTGANSSGDVVRVYSGRHYGEEETFQRFFEETGIQVEFLFGSDAELRERIEAEGENTQADVYMTVDAGNLYLAAEEGVFQPLESGILEDSIPQSLRDPENRWFGLGVRSRTIVYNPERVQPSELSTYEALTDPKWKGRLCMRDSSNVYTQSMVASLVSHHGYEGAVGILKGWVANETEILGSDVLVLETIAEGGCDVGLTNHYYLARELEDDEDFGVDLFWANQGDRGVHVNVSGAGVTQNADNPELARRLLEWLATDGQDDFVRSNHEYPANPGVEPDALVLEHFGNDFKRDQLGAADYGSLNAQAIRAMDEAGYE
ncbi:MAG TPA: extracellular solute-binding protein [Actinomycetota bacterium]|nr:extracellular solute-binding protein [Actinomycetota bacterium]